MRPRFAPVKNEGNLINPGEDFLAAFGPLSPLGAKVNALTALGVSTVFACVNYIASIVSTLPIELYKKLPGGGRVEVDDHPARIMLKVKPNPYSVPSDVKYCLAWNQALHGNAYAILAFDRLGRAAMMKPLMSRNVTMTIKGGFPNYRVAGEEREEYSFSEILHLRGMTPDGVTGYSPMALTSGLIGLAQTLEENAGRFFANSSRPGMVYTVAPGINLTEPQREAIRDQLRKAYEGVENAYKTLVVEGGGDVKMARANNDASQFDEIAKRTHQQICQVFGVPPHKVQILDNATFSNIEQQQIQAVQDLFRPWCFRWEEAFRGAFLAPFEMKNHFFKHNLDAVLQADIKTRNEAHSTALQNGWRCINEVRALEDLNPIEGGDTYVRQLNMIDITAPAPEPATAPAPTQQAA